MEKSTENNPTDTHDIYTEFLINIKNIQPLDENMINNINNMTNEQKMSIIKVLNDIVINFKFLLE